MSSTFNTVSGDSETSTNDSVAGKAGASPVTLIGAIAAGNRARQGRLAAKVAGLVRGIPDPVLDPAWTLCA